MSKRARGRPALNDDALLWAVAMKLAKKEAPSPRSAIVQALPRKPAKGSSDSDVRRLQRKWRQKGGALLAQAKEALRRQERERAEFVRMTGLSSLTFTVQLPDFQAEMAAATGRIADTLASGLEAFRRMEVERSLQTDGIAATLGGINSTSNAWTQLGDSAEMLRRELARSAPSLREIERLLGVGGPNGI